MKKFKELDKKYYLEKQFRICLLNSKVNPTQSETPQLIMSQTSSNTQIQHSRFILQHIKALERLLGWI